MAQRSTLKAVTVPTKPTALTGAFGSTGTAIADVTGTFSQTILNNNFRALEDRLNLIATDLQTMGIYD